MGSSYRFASGARGFVLRESGDGADEDLDDTAAELKVRREATDADFFGVAVKDSEREADAWELLEVSIKQREEEEDHK